MSFIRSLLIVVIPRRRADDSFSFGIWVRSHGRRLVTEASRSSSRRFSSIKSDQLLTSALFQAQLDQPQVHISDLGVLTLTGAETSFTEAISGDFCGCVGGLPPRTSHVSPTPIPSTVTALEQTVRDITREFAGRKRSFRRRRHSLSPSHKRCRRYDRERSRASERISSWSSTSSSSNRVLLL